MDSTISFYEQDGIHYETVLSAEHHIPTMLTYNNRLDTFLWISSYCELECYRYQDIGQTIDLQKQRQLHPIWSVCIGEYPLDVQIQQITELVN